MSACSKNLLSFISDEEKPNTNFYTEQLVKDLKETEDMSFETNVVYMNFYKGKILSKEEKKLVYKFLNSLEEKNFIESPSDLPEKIKYKVYITLDKSKYVINVYNDTYAALYPWDGDYPMDFISMKDTYPAYNLFGLCKHFISKLKE